MLRKLLRPGLIKQTAVVRGGGGYPRPDVPLLVNYYNKRELSIYELNVWWYDDVMPEYLVSYQDSHCHDHWNTFREWGRLFPTLFAAMFAAGLYLHFFYSTRLHGTSYDVASSPFITSVERTAKERYGARRSFLDLELTGEQGNIHAKCDGANWLRGRVADYIKKGELKKQINIEAKNFILRVESEARKKYESL